MSRLKKEKTRFEKRRDFMKAERKRMKEWRKTLVEGGDAGGLLRLEEK